MIPNHHPFRLGTTSYIIPDDILPNVRYLADKVQDIELVLFELDDGPSNLPPPAVLAELIELTRQHCLSYTVHLPLDLRLGAQGDEQHASLIKARRVIECTRALAPWAYVLHLDGREVKQGASPAALAAWTDQAVRALELAAGWAGGAERLAVENLEGYPPEFWNPVLMRIPVGRCVDIGHLWRDGHDPLPFLEQALPAAPVIHLHGVGSRDHQSLAHIAPQALDSVLCILLERGYHGVVTLEVFNEEDFLSSWMAVQSSLARLRNSPPPDGMPGADTASAEIVSWKDRVNDGK